MKPAVLLTPNVRIRLLGFAAVALAAFGIGFLLFSVDRARLVVKQYGYYSIAFTFAWGVVAWIRARRAAAASLAVVPRRDWWRIGLLITAATFVVACTTPLGYKVLYDEMVLQSTALDMHIYREVSTVVRGYLIDGVFAPLDTFVDKRPMFFPFLVSVLHDLVGYREANAFWLNLALYPLILVQVYLLARRVGGHVAGVAAVVALGTLSTLAQSATSAGMETLNLAMLLVTMHAALLYLDRPDDVRLSALLLSVVLLAQSRYESSLFVLPVALVALQGWRTGHRILLPTAAICAPLLLVPYAIHNTYVSGTPPLWELRENTATRFGTEYLLPNLRHAWHYFFDTAGQCTNSLWLSAAGFLALGVALFCGWQARARWRSCPPAHFVLGVFGAGIVANLGVLMFYYWGQLDDPIVARLALPLEALMAIAIGFAVSRFVAVARWLPWFAAGGAVLAYLWSGVVANEQHGLRNTLAAELDWECRVVQSRPPGERLVITNKSSLPFMLRRIPAINFDRARRRIDALQAQLGGDTFREILVTQDFRPTSATGDLRMMRDDELPAWFHLETVAERRFGAHVDRISRLVSIEPHASAHPAKSAKAK